MLIVLCLNIYMANYLRIDIRCLWAQSTEYKLNNTSNSKLDWNEAEIIFQKYCLVLTKCRNCICRLTIVFLFFLNKNIILIIISILVHIDRKNSESCFLLLFLFQKT